MLTVSAIVTATGWTAPLGTPSAVERLVDQLGDRGLGEVADGQVGDRDADLGTRQLGGERAQSALDTDRARIALGGGLVDLAPVDRDEGELGGDEDPAGGDEQKSRPEEDPLGQRRLLEGWEVMAKTLPAGAGGDRSGQFAEFGDTGSRGNLRFARQGCASRGPRIVTRTTNGAVDGRSDQCSARCHKTQCRQTRTCGATAPCPGSAPRQPLLLRPHAGVRSAGDVVRAARGRGSRTSSNHSASPTPRPPSCAPGGRVSRTRPPSCGAARWRGSKAAGR